MNTASVPALILFEQTGRWAAALQRQSVAARLSLIETRSFAEFEEQLRQRPRALAGVELAAGAEARVVGFLGRLPVAFDTRGIVVFSQPRLRSYEAMCREAGAIHFISCELEILSLTSILDRYLSDPAFAKLNDDYLPLEDRIRARLPWTSA